MSVCSGCDSPHHTAARCPVITARVAQREQEIDDAFDTDADVHGCTCAASKPEHVHADTCKAWVDCPDCNGTGEVADYWNGYVGCYETKRCPSCDGEAWLPVHAYVGLMAGRCPHSVPLDYDCTDCDREVAAARASGALTVQGGWDQPPPF